MVKLSIALVLIGVALAIGYIVANKLGGAMTLLADAFRSLWALLWTVSMMALIVFGGPKLAIIGIVGVALFFAISLTNYRRVTERDIRGTLMPDLEFR